MKLTFPYKTVRMRLSVGFEDEDYVMATVPMPEGPSFSTVPVRSGTPVDQQLSA